MKMAEIPRQNLPGLPGQVFAATALFYNVLVLSRDPHVQPHMWDVLGACRRFWRTGAPRAGSKLPGSEARAISRTPHRRDFDAPLRAATESS